MLIIMTPFHPKRSIEGETIAEYPSTVRATETLAPTFQVHLPFVYRNFPPVIQVPEGE
jgi:hypothetical protein